MRLEYCSSCGAHLGLFPPCHCRACGTEFWWNPKPGVSVLVEHDDRLLLMRRAHDSWADHWEVPGGFIEPNETPAETPVRECREETGQDIAVTGILRAWSDTYGNDEPPDTIVSIYFVAEVVGTPSPHVTDEAREVAWFAPGEIPSNLAFPSEADPRARLLANSPLKHLTQHWPGRQVGA